MATGKEGTINLVDFLPVQAICVDLKAQSKSEVFKEMAQVLSVAHQIQDSAILLNALLEREKLGSTGIGQGVAIPHGKTEQLQRVVAALGISKKGVQFDAIDGEPVHLVFTLVAPQNASALHLKILAKISRLLKDKLFRQELQKAQSAQEVVTQIQEEEEY